LRDASGAFASRLIVLSSAASFLNKEDPGLKRALEQELPGILNWALEGLGRLHKRGYFEIPTSSRNLHKQILILSSPIKAFLEDCCTLAPDESIKKEQLFNTWRRWCERQNLPAGSSVAFGKLLRAALPNYKESRPAGAKRARVLMGVGLAKRR
jgi:putative DNA primase/helicase